MGWDSAVALWVACCLHEAVYTHAGLLQVFEPPGESSCHIYAVAASSGWPHPEVLSLDAERTAEALSEDIEDLFGANGPPRRQSASVMSSPTALGMVAGEQGLCSPQEESPCAGSP